MPRGKPKSAGLFHYLKEAFLFRWNLLFAIGGAAGAMLSGKPEVFLPLVGAAEAAYLAGITTMPRFRRAVDAKVHAEDREDESRPDTQQSLRTMLDHLDSRSLRRFQALRRRCLDMQRIARGVGGRARGRDTDELNNPGLDRLLWAFLRMLTSQASLRRFLDSTDEDSIRKKLDATKRHLEEAETELDERRIRSLRDSFATRELQLENYEKAFGNYEFVALELDRLEAKIQTLSEMAVNRQDPDYITREVDSVAASIQDTEEAIEELHLVDGLLDGLHDPPPILSSRLEEFE